MTGARNSLLGFVGFSHGARWNDALKLATTTSLHVPLNALFTNTLRVNTYNLRLFDTLIFIQVVKTRTEQFHCALSCGITC